MTNEPENAATSSDKQADTPVRVVIVEDNDALRQTLCSLIKRTAGMSLVAGYRSGETALQAAGKDLPDIVLMDIRLPGMNGIECVKELRRVLPSAKAVMLTAYEEADDIFKALSAGAFGYLLKSVSASRIRDAIMEAHSGGAPFSGSVARRLVSFFHHHAKPAPSKEVELHTLSPRENEVLQLLAEGQAYKQIAAILNISINTVCSHIKRIYEKLHIHSQSEAVRIYHESKGG